MKCRNCKKDLSGDISWGFFLFRKCPYCEGET